MDFIHPAQGPYENGSREQDYGKALSMTVMHLSRVIQISGPRMSETTESQWRVYIKIEGVLRSSIEFARCRRYFSCCHSIFSRQWISLCRVYDATHLTLEAFTQRVN
jgi:hypothetical protein